MVSPEVALWIKKKIVDVKGLRYELFVLLVSNRVCNNNSLINVVQSRVNVFLFLWFVLTFISPIFYGQLAAT